LRGAPTALAGNDLVALHAIAAVYRSGNYGLNDSLCPYRTRKVFERVLANINARLILPSLQQVERKVPQTVGVFVVACSCVPHSRPAEQRIKAATESFFR